MGAANNGETESALFFGFDKCGCGAAGSRLCAFGRLALYSAELFCVCEDEVHVLVECQHLPSHLSPIIQCNSHSVVDEILHLPLFVRHNDRLWSLTRLVLSKD